MKLLLKIIGYTAAGILGLIVVAFISLQFISQEQYKKWIAAATESATGRTLAINGELDVKIGTKIGLTANDVNFANAQWGTRDSMVTVDRLFVQLRLLPLVTGVIDFIVEVDAPDVLLETDAEGTGNWVFGTAVKKSEPAGAEEIDRQADRDSFTLPVKPYIRNFEVNNLVFAYSDSAHAKNIEVAAEQLRIFVEGSDIPLTLKAAYQGAPIELRGSLGSIEQWHANQATAVSLQGRLNEASISIDGSTGPLLPRPSARLNIGVAADSVSTFDAFAGMELPELEKLDVSLVLVAEEGRLAVEDAKAGLNDPRLAATVTGGVASLSDFSGIDISTEITTEKGTELIKGFNLELPYSLPQTIRMKGGVSGSIDSLSVEGLELQAKDQGLDVGLRADLQDVLGQTGGSADLTLNVESTSIITKLTGLELPVLGPLNGTAKLVSAGDDLQLESLQLELRDPALAASIDGSAQKVGRLSDDEFQISGIELSGKAESDKIKEFIERFGVDVPVELPASFDLRLKAAGSLKTLAVTDLQAAVKDSGIAINLSGTVENIIDLSGIAAQVNGAVEDTAVLSRFAGVDLPALGSLNLKANLASSGDTYRIDDLELQLDGETATARVNGAIKDLLALTTVVKNPGAYAAAGIDAALTMQTSSVSTLVKRASGIEIPEIGAVDLDGHLASSAESITLDTLHASLTGQGLKTTAEVVIEDLIALQGLKAKIAGDFDSLSSISSLVQKELPQTGPWSVQIQADSIDNSPGGFDLSAELGGEGITAAIDAELADVKTLQTFQTDLRVDVDSIARVASFFDYEIAEDKALNITGKAIGEPGEYRLENFAVKADEGEMQADLAYLFPPKDNVDRPKLSGKVTIAGFDLTPYLAVDEKTAEDVEEEPAAKEEEKKTVAKDVAGSDQDRQEQEEEEPATAKKLFSDKPFSLGWLNDYDADLKLEAVDVLLPQGNTLDAVVDVILDQGLLAIDPIDLKESYGGTGSGYFKLDSRSGEAIMDTVIDLVKFTSPRFGGTIDLYVDLDGKGRSLASVMGSLDGYFAASLENLELARSYLSQFGAGLLKHLNPLDSQKTVLECGVVRFDIEDGMADFRKRIAAQTTEVTWLGGGEINLKTEELDVGISPKARGAISSLTNINLASLLHIGGTLAEPKIGIDLADVAMKYAGYTAFVATGGLSFLAQKALETAQANVDQCKRILGKLENQEMEPDPSPDSVQGPETDKDQ